jgi:hypothetical protein
MPIITRRKDIEAEWEQMHVEDLNSQEKRGDELHVSDLILCLRQTTLGRIYDPKWDFMTAMRFAFGRAFETALAQTYLRGKTQELEIRFEGMVAHIDFGDDPNDWECKLTWGKRPSDAQAFFEDKPYWLEQAGTYAVARGRTQSRFAVFHMMPVPGVSIYVIDWDEDDLEDYARVMVDRKDYVKEHMEAGTHPPKTHMTWLCSNCSLKWACDKELAQGR